MVVCHKNHEIWPHIFCFRPARWLVGRWHFLCDSQVYQGAMISSWIHRIRECSTSNRTLDKARYRCLIWCSCQTEGFPIMPPPRMSTYCRCNRSEDCSARSTSCMVISTCLNACPAVGREQCLFRTVESVRTTKCPSLTPRNLSRTHPARTYSPHYCRLLPRSDWCTALNHRLRHTDAPTHTLQGVGLWY